MGHLFKCSDFFYVSNSDIASVAYFQMNKLRTRHHFVTMCFFLYLKVQEKFKHIAGGEYIGFSNAT